MQLVLHPAPNWYSSSILDVNYYGSLVAVGTRNTVTFFDAATGRIEGELSVSGSERIVGVKFNRAPGLRHVLATAGSDGSVKVWDADARREIRRIARLSGPVGNVEFSAIAPHVLVAANSRGELVTYHLDQKEPAPNYASLGELSPSPVRSLASTPPRKVEENDYSCAEMAAGREDGCICIIEVIDGALLAFDKAPGPVHAVGWNSSGDGVVAACKGFSVAVWTWDRPHRRLVGQDPNGVDSGQGDEKSDGRMDHSSLASKRPCCVLIPGEDHRCGRLGRWEARVGRCASRHHIFPGSTLCRRQAPTPVFDVNGPHNRSLVVV